MTGDCVLCDGPVPAIRVEALTEMGKAITCLSCAENNPEPAYYGVQMYAHKTGGEVCMVRAASGEIRRRMQREYRRCR